MSSSAINLLIIGVAIILVIVVYQNLLPGGDSFVGKVPMVPIGSAQYAPYYNGAVPGMEPMGQPEMYKHQLYQAKAPYYNDTVMQEGRPCNQNTGCGIMGACVDGVCRIKDQNETVFNMKL